MFCSCGLNVLISDMLLDLSDLLQVRLQSNWNKRLYDNLLSIFFSFT